VTRRAHYLPGRRSRAMVAEYYGLVGLHGCRAGRGGSVQHSNDPRPASESASFRLILGNERWRSRRVPARVPPWTRPHRSRSPSLGTDRRGGILHESSNSGDAPVSVLFRSMENKWFTPPTSAARVGQPRLGRFQRAGPRLTVLWPADCGRQRRRSRVTRAARGGGHARGGAGPFFLDAHPPT